MNEKEAKELINSIGAMSEMAALYFNELVRNGVPFKEAATITASVMCEMIRNSKEK
jgi:argininosuccinate lyase